MALVKYHRNKDMQCDQSCDNEQIAEKIHTETVELGSVQELNL